MSTLPNTDDIEVSSEFEPLPAGTYKVEIESSEVKPTQKGWPMLRVTLSVLEGDYAGRKVFDQFLLEHDNPKAREIGLRKLKQIKHAIGKPQAVQEEDLWGAPLLARISIEKDATGQYGDKNRIQGFMPVAAAGGNGNGGDGPRRPAAPAKPEAKRPAGSPPPWRK